MTRALTAGIDAGGTTFKLAVADGDTVLAERRVPTTTPEETLPAAAAALSAMADEAGGRLARLGVGCFGPVDIDPGSDGYGCLLATPKPGWSGAPVLRTLTAALGVPGALDTDVNAALAAERRFGAARGTESAAYVTVGTGIGVGVWVNGSFAGAPRHLEMGHVRVARHAEDAGFAGVCAFHGDCLEGLCAAPALVARYGALEELPAEHPGWDVAACYLGQLCLAIMLSHRVERIVLGGGVMGAPGLLGRVRAAYDGLVAGYLDGPGESVVVGAGLGGAAGVRGALLVAERA